MSAAETFNNPDFPIEVRLKAAIHVLEHTQALNAALHRRKTPPEREELAEAQRKLAQAQDTIRFWRENAEVWKKVAEEMSALADEVKAGTAYARMERERDHWKAQWRSATARLAVLIEHQGNVELLEDELTCLERQNAVLRAAGPAGGGEGK